MQAPDWTFTSTVSETRREKLGLWQSFDQIADAVGASPVRWIRWEAASALHLKPANRASFEVDVGHDVYDAFYNSPLGYRGQFAISEIQGEKANRLILDKLRPTLLRVAEGKAPRDEVAASVDGVQAKIWIVESEVDEQLTGQPGIDYADWDFFEPNSQGLRAPYGARLGVKGAWVRGSMVIINPEKRHRSRHIHDMGDSK